MLNAVDNGLLKVRFAVGCLLIKLKELQHVGFLQDILWAEDNLSLSGKFFDGFLVSTQGQPFVEAGGHLAFQLGHGPTFVCRFDFVETLLSIILNCEEQDIV